MKMQHRMLASVGIVLLSATVSFAQQVKTDYDRSADFSQYKTYSWEKVQTQDPLWVNRIKEAVNADLTAKGWMAVESGGNVAIVAMDMTKNHQSLNTYYDGFGGGWGWRRFGGMGMGEATTTTENTPVGTLNVDIFDSQTKQLLWRGKSSETLSGKADKNEKKLEKDVADMFKKFPPPAKG